MSFFPAILAALAPPFLLILLGFGLKRAGVLHPAHVPILNGLVLKVTLPALILLGLLRAPALSLVWPSPRWPCSEPNAPPWPSPTGWDAPCACRVPCLGPHCWSACSATPASLATH